MRDNKETMLGKFWLISCIDCNGSEACTILCAVWCPKSAKKKAINYTLKQGHQEGIIQ